MLKPGKPGVKVPAGKSLTMVLPLMSFRLSPAASKPRFRKACVTYLWPKRALYPSYAVEVPVAGSVAAAEPSAFGSHGNLSGKPPLAAEQSVLPFAQWTATPSKSAKGSALGGTLFPKMVVRSAPVFSISMSAAPAAPTSQPARVKGTHGAGVLTPFG